MDAVAVFNGNFTILRQNGASRTSLNQVFDLSAGAKLG
jgi:hypothetical protein